MLGLCMVPNEILFCLYKPSYLKIIKLYLETWLCLQLTCAEKVPQGGKDIWDYVKTDTFNIFFKNFRIFYFYYHIINTIILCIMVRITIINITTIITIFIIIIFHYNLLVLLVYYILLIYLLFYYKY